MTFTSLSITPRYIAPSAWWQHVPIAHWLVGELKPERIVELGTHYGVSFFSFCEAAESLSEGTFVYAVDTWNGDEHAGVYDESVYIKVARHWEKYHRTRARLIRSTFDEAATYFEDNSVDLLHIDGLHTYEAVRNDFQTWLHILKDDCVILFHDINVRERGFGVWKLWQELRSDPEYGATEILSGHGLGILIRGQKYQHLIEDISSLRKLLTSKGELLEKLAELTPGGSLGKSESEIETEQARAEAEQARTEAEQARAEAEQARAEAEQARTEAEQARTQAEQTSESLRSIQESKFWKYSQPARLAIDSCKKYIKL